MSKSPSSKARGREFHNGIRIKTDAEKQTARSMHYVYSLRNLTKSALVDFGRYHMKKKAAKFSGRECPYNGVCVYEYANATVVSGLDSNGFPRKGGKRMKEGLELGPADSGTRKQTLSNCDLAELGFEWKYGQWIKWGNGYGAATIRVLKGILSPLAV